MRLPEDEERYLNDKGYDWALEPDGAGACLVLRGYSIDASRYAAAATDLMIRIPPQYPMAALDMFYADPPVTLRGGGYPDRADQFENYAGRRWQRFSRHLTSPWRVGVDSIASFLAVVAKELRVTGASA